MYYLVLTLVNHTVPHKYSWLLESVSAWPDTYINIDVLYAISVSYLRH